jgi:hypothetical protein
VFRHRLADGRAALRRKIAAGARQQTLSTFLPPKPVQGVDPKFKPPAGTQNMQGSQLEQPDISNVPNLSLQSSAMQSIGHVQQQLPGGSTFPANR